MGRASVMQRLARGLHHRILTLSWQAAKDFGAAESGIEHTARRVRIGFMTVGDTTMPIRPFLKGERFDTESVHIMSTAFELVCIALRIAIAPMTFVRQSQRSYRPCQRRRAQSRHSVRADAKGNPYRPRRLARGLAVRYIPIMRKSWRASLMRSRNQPGTDE